MKSRLVAVTVLGFVGLAVLLVLLAGGAPSATVLVNGGEIARQDVAQSLAAGRPVVVVAGTGRLADELAATSERSSLLQAVDLAAEPGAVTTRLRAMLETDRKDECDVSSTNLP